MSKKSLGLSSTLRRQNQCESTETLQYARMNVKFLFWGGLALMLVGCKNYRPKTSYVGGQRDPEAVAVRLHNRTNAELIVKPYVRERLRGVSLNDVLRMPAMSPEGRYDSPPDVELAMFRDLPLKLELIGAYSLEVSTSETEARLGVVDVSRKEMMNAKEAGRLTVIFREDGIHLILGRKNRIVPWLRPIPRPRSLRLRS